jgi:ABC-type sugar transport system substrate-binding protein
MNRSKIIVILLVTTSLLLALLAACAAPTPQVITKEVTKEVVKEVVKEVPKEVQVEVTKEVVKEVQVEVTAVPATLWSPAEVVAASGANMCNPVTALPKQFKKDWTVGYINMDKSHPFFSQWEAGMQAAAKAYGVKYIGMDAANGASIDQLDPLLAQKPDLVGSQKDMDAIASKALKLNIPYLNIDEGQTEYSPYTYGVPNATAGRLAGEKLVEGLKTKMAGDWKGRELFFLEFTHGGVPACVTRTAAAAKAVKEGMGLDDAHVLKQDPFTVGTTPPDMILATLTAHPKAVFGLIPCWDALGVEPYNTAKDGGRENDLMMVTLGGDKPTIEFLKSKPKGYYAVMEFSPWCEGWSWVETSLAILEGVPFKPYAVDKFITQDTVDARYAELYP